MVDFLTNIFESSGSKEKRELDNSYKHYKSLYGDVIKVYKRGDKYAIVNTLYSRGIPTPHVYIHDDYSHKRRFVEMCKEHEEDNKKVEEM